MNAVLAKTVDRALRSAWPAALRDWRRMGLRPASGAVVMMIDRTCGACGARASWPAIVVDAGRRPVGTRAFCGRCESVTPSRRMRAWPVKRMQLADATPWDLLD